MFDFFNKYDATTMLGQLSVIDFATLMFFIILSALFMVLSMEGLATLFVSFMSYQVAKLRSSFRRKMFLLESEGYPTKLIIVGYAGVGCLIATVLFTLLYML